MYLYIGMDLALWRGLSDLVEASCFLGLFGRNKLQIL